MCDAALLDVVCGTALDVIRGVRSHAVACYAVLCRITCLSHIIYRPADPDRARWMKRGLTRMVLVSPMPLVRVRLHGMSVAFVAARKDDEPCWKFGRARK